MKLLVNDLDPASPPGLEDRREEHDPIKLLLMQAPGWQPDREDVEQMGMPMGGAYNIEEYQRNNPTNTPLAQSSLAEQAGARDLVEQSIQNQMRAMERYKKLIYPPDEIPLRDAEKKLKRK